MKRILAVLLSAMVLSSIAMLSGCKNNGNGSAVESVTESKSTNNAVVSKEKLAALSTELETYKSQPNFNATKSIDAKKISKNKKIAVIADSSSNTYSSYISQELKSVAEKVGFKEILAYDTDGTVNSHTSALENAVSDQCAAVVLIGNINKDEISLAIENAQAHGIKVISIDNTQVGTNDHFVDSSAKTDYVAEAKALADYAIVEKEGRVNALLVTPSDVRYADEMKKAVTDELTKYSDGYCTELAMEISNTAVNISDAVKKALGRDTNINCVIVLHDNMLKDSVDALEMTQAMSRVTFLARGGGTELFTQVQNGNIATAVSESYEWTAYTAVDYILRVLNGEDNPEISDIPFMMISYDNVKKIEESEGTEESSSDEEKTDDTPLIEKIFTKTFKNQYLNLWGLGENSEDSQAE